MPPPRTRQPAGIGGLGSEPVGVGVRGRSAPNLRLSCALVLRHSRLQMPACRARGKRVDRRVIRRHRRTRRDTRPSGQTWARLGGLGHETCLLDARPAAIAGILSGVLPGKPWKLLPRTGFVPRAPVFADATVRHSERSSAGKGSDPNLTRLWARLTPLCDVAFGAQQFSLMLEPRRETLTKWDHEGTILVRTNDL